MQVSDAKVQKFGSLAINYGFFSSIWGVFWSVKLVMNKILRILQSHVQTQKYTHKNRLARNH